jgi:hypothetical protein
MTMTMTMAAAPVVPHAVARQRAERLARSAKPFLARGGPRGERCAGCRLLPSHCLCALRPAVPTRAGMCLLMGDVEALKPSNTGWLIADVVADTFAFGWARTVVHPDLLALLADPQWQPCAWNWRAKPAPRKRWRPTSTCSPTTICRPRTSCRWMWTTHCTSACAM